VVDMLTVWLGTSACGQMFRCKSMCVPCKMITRLSPKARSQCHYVIQLDVKPAFSVKCLHPCIGLAALGWQVTTTLSHG
jgi:hypothetical protein